MERYDIFINDDNLKAFSYDKTYVKTIDGDYVAIYDDSVRITAKDKIMMELLRVGKELNNV